MEKKPKENNSIKFKVRIVKSSEGTAAFSSKSSGNDLRDIPIDITKANSLIKSLSLTQESKEKVNGSTIYIYS